MRTGTALSALHGVVRSLWHDFLMLATASVLQGMYTSEHREIAALRIISQSLTHFLSHFRFDLYISPLTSKIPDRPADKCLKRKHGYRDQQKFEQSYTCMPHAWPTFDAAHTASASNSSKGLQIHSDNTLIFKITPLWNTALCLLRSPHSASIWSSSLCYSAA